MIITATARADGNVVKRRRNCLASAATLYDMMHRFGLK